MKVPVPDVILPAGRLGRVHFIGIGGAGLSAIARIMAAQGVAVTGSDDQETPFLAGLRERAVPCYLGYHPDHLGDADTVVVTTAADEANPEVLEARRRGLRVLPRSAGLAAVMADRRVVAVAGTHGKTTTTSLLTVALLACGVDLTYAIGGVLSATGRNAEAGASEIFVAEADESDGAFLVYEPAAAIVTNVDADHLDQWGTPEAYAAAFDEFADRIAPGGFLVCCIDDPGAARLAERHRASGRRTITVSTRPGADADLGPDALDGVTLWSPGDHFRADALAALAAGLELGFDRDGLLAGLGAFTGTGRRMEPKGEAGGVRVYDSYAHHPTEIAGDLQAARLIAGTGRLIVAFQPHLVSRTRIFGVAMGEALSGADEVVVLDLYLAREAADPAVTSRLVADAVALPPEAVATVSLEQAAAELVSRARPGDLVLTLGAGTVTGVGPEVLALIASRSPEPGDG